ncbi:HK97 gp10 family phage protein [Bacillus sp. ISL-46]|uniref:HK97 gp10 family phage protein n=1 Tax=Bacillus sp. ISL-46 TaxID=2819129 RepID=UPI001BEC9B03|nr:HK97 gp10 family phage protein [Bacillus sp. ISL-46]MBT2722313.1 HK97 gp10 family phage protein [Bacillus sp. ISL-46]
MARRDSNNNAQRYSSFAPDVKKALGQLEKKALREVAKFLRKEIKRAVPVDEGDLKKNVGSWVRGKASEAPVLQIGVYDAARARKKGYTYAYHAHLVQFGARNGEMPATDYMRGPVFGNIDLIRQLQAEYLRQIEHLKANGLPEVEDEEADD